MKIVTAAEMREIDRITSERFGVPSLTLMENAGTAVAEFVLSKYPSAERIGVICGKGNNGGDGFVAARKLQEAGKAVRIVLLAEPAELRGDAAEMFARLPVAPVIVQSSEYLRREQARAVFESEVLLDAILGTGFKPPVRGLYAEAIQLLNASSRRWLRSIFLPGRMPTSWANRLVRLRAPTLWSPLLRRVPHMFSADLLMGRR